MIENRFKIDNGFIYDVLGFIEPIPFISMYQAIEVRDLLNGNWSEFNEQKCLIQRLRNENRILHRINGELHHRLGELNE